MVINIRASGGPINHKEDYLITMVNNENNKRNSNQVAVNDEVVSYGYYSKLLKKPFDTVAELKEAEEEYTKAHAAEIAAAQEHKNLLKKIDEAYLNVEKAQKEYDTLVNEHIQKYGYYHKTYRTTIRRPSLFDIFF